MTGLTGRCLCGQVHYTSSASLMAAICHCRHCQRQSGSAFAVNVVVTRKKLHIIGETRVFYDTGASGLAVARHFCGSCGSPIMSLAESAPGVAFLKGGTLDEPAAIVPSMEIWTDCALSWAGLATALPHHPANPPSA